MLRMPNRELLDKVEEYFNTNENWIKKDGIVDEVAFAQARVKILWILREMNEKEGYRQSGGDMRKDWRACAEKNNLNPYHAPQGGYSKTYALIIKTSGAILKNEWSVGGYQSWCREVLPQIAIINAKKMAGGARAKSASRADFRPSRPRVVRRLHPRPADRTRYCHRHSGAGTGHTAGRPC